MGIIERHRNIATFTVSSLLRRKKKNISLVVVYVLIVFILGSVVMSAETMKREADFLLAGTPEVVVQKLVAGRYDSIPVSYAEKISSIRGIGSVRARLWGHYSDAETGTTYTCMASDQDGLEAGQIAIGSEISNGRQVFVGDRFSFTAYDGKPLTFVIKKILSAESKLVSSDLILLCEADCRTLLGIPQGYATDLVLQVKNRKEMTTVATKVYQILPDTRPILREEILRTYHTVFSWRSGLLIMVLSGAVFAFIVLAWDNATGLSAEEKKEIGILKAIGWDTSEVLLVKFWESSIISLFSFFAGLALAYYHIFFSSVFLFGPVLKGWSVLYPGFKPALFVDFYNAATLFFITVIPYAVATIIPSWRAATIDPGVVMR